MQSWESGNTLAVNLSKFLFISSSFHLQSSFPLIYPAAGKSAGGGPKVPETAAPRKKLILTTKPALVNWMMIVCINGRLGVNQYRWLLEYPRKFVLCRHVKCRSAGVME